MKINIRAVLSILALLAAAGVGAAYQGTVPERLAAAGRSLVGGTTVPSGPTPSLAQILANTDLLVRGFVGNGRSYLSHDQMEVLTEFVIQKPVILFERAPKVYLKPGPADVLTVVQRGGNVEIGHLTYAEVHEALPALESNSEYLFMLKNVGGRYYIAGSFYGAFALKGGRVVPLVRKAGFAPQVANRPVEESVSTLLTEVRRVR
jgi:hypothetical protein